MAATGSLLDFGIVMYLKDNVSREATKVSASLRRIGKDTKLMADTFDNNIGKAITGLGVFTSGLYALNGVAKSLQVAGEFEQISVAINVMAGSVANGTKLLKDLQNVALSTPFDFKDLAKNTKMLMAYGIEHRQALKDIQMIGDIAAGVGIERLPFISLGFAQIQAKGRLMGDEAKQLMESGVPIVPAIGKRYFPELSAGEATKRISELMEQKRIVVTAEEVREIMMSMTEEGGRFFGMMEKQSKTFLGMLSNVREQIYFTNIAIGDALLPSVKALLADVMKGANKVSLFAKTLEGQFFIRAGAGAMLLTTALGGVLLAASLSRISIQLLSNLLSHQRKEAFLTAIANKAYGQSLRILGSEFKALGILTGKFLGKSLAIGWFAFGFIQLFKAVTGAKEGIRGMLQIIGALYEAFNNFKVNENGIIKTFIGMETAQTLMGNNVYDAFQKLLPVMYNLTMFAEGMRRGFRQAYQQLFGFITVVNTAVNGLQSVIGLGGGEAGGFKLAVNIGRFVAMIISLATASYALKVAVKGIAAPFRLLLPLLGKIGNTQGWTKPLVKAGQNVKKVWSSVLSLFKSIGGTLAKVAGLLRSAFKSVGKSPIAPALPNMGRLRSANRGQLDNLERKMYGLMKQEYQLKDMLNKQGKYALKGNQRRLAKQNLANVQNQLGKLVPELDKAEMAYKANQKRVAAQNKAISSENARKKVQYAQAWKTYKQDKVIYGQKLKERRVARKALSNMFSSRGRGFKSFISGMKSSLGLFTKKTVSSLSNSMRRNRSLLGNNSIMDVLTGLAIIASIVGLTAIVWKIYTAINKTSKERARLQGIIDNPNATAFQRRVAQEQLNALNSIEANREHERQTKGWWQRSGATNFPMLWPAASSSRMQKIAKEQARFAAEQYLNSTVEGTGKTAQALYGKDYEKMLQQTIESYMAEAEGRPMSIYNTPITGIKQVGKRGSGDVISVPSNATQYLPGINNAMNQAAIDKAIKEGRYKEGKSPDGRDVFILENTVVLPNGTPLYYKRQEFNLQNVLSEFQVK